MSTENEKRIDYIEFGVTDLAGTRRFYSELFGWTFEDYGPEYMSFDDGRLTGGFTTMTPVRPGGPLVIVYTGDLEEMQSNAEKAGGRITRPIFSFPGGRRFHFTDPSGNELAVWSDQ
jgi:hypothetical protein